MSSTGFLAKARQHVAVGTSLFTLLANLGAPTLAAAQQPAKLAKTATPIKHVIVIIGENRSFDHVFATYKSPSGDSVSNLLSKGIVRWDGTPGPNYSLSAQYSAVDSTTVGSGTYSIAPPGEDCLQQQSARRGRWTHRRNHYRDRQRPQAAAA